MGVAVVTNGALSSSSASAAPSSLVSGQGDPGMGRVDEEELLDTDLLKTARGVSSARSLPSSLPVLGRPDLSRMCW